MREVPEGWEVKRIKHVIKELVSGGTPESGEQSYWSDDETGISWVSISDISSESIIHSTEKRITKFGLNSKRLQILPKGTLLYSIYASLGKTAILGIPAVTNQAILGIMIDEHYIQKAYLQFWFDHIEKNLIQISSTNTQNNLNAEKVKNLPVFFPTYLTQSAIATFLDHETSRLDTLFAEKERQIELLNEKRAALISHAVTKGLNPNVKMKNSTIEWIAKIPNNWNEMKAKDLFCQLFLPPQSNAGIVTVFRDGQVTLRENRRTEGFTNAILEVGYQSVRKGDLVIHSMDAFAGAIGVSDSDGKCTGEYVVCEPILTDVNNFYYGLFLREMALAKYILAICPSVRERAPRFRFNTFKEVILPVPPFEEQKKIVDYIENETKKIDTFKERLQRSIDLLQEYRTSLISAAVTGKIDVRAEAKQE